MASSQLQIGSRVEVTGKNVQGTVAFIGITSFAAGKWVGVILDEPKGKNNGSVQDKSYFQCEDKHGTFVRAYNLSLIDELGNKIDLSNTASSEDLTPRSTPGSMPPGSTGSGLKSRFGSSRTSVSGKPTPAKSREDISLNTPGGSEPRKASFVESSLLSSTKRTPSSRDDTTTPVAKMRPRIAKSLSALRDHPAGARQTGFVENLKPQFTPGQALVSPGVQTQRPSPASFIDPVEHEVIKAQVQDLTEKLETVRVKHREKVHEIDSMRIKLDQAAEFKIKIMESQAALKKELEQVKKEKQDVLEAHDDMGDMVEALEMATVDKEMAEEKVEALQMELTEAKEKIEELTLDFELLKAEFDKISGSSGDTEGEEGNVATSYQMKQLEEQNLRLRDTLVRMRDLSAHEKHEIQKLQKDLEDKKTKTNELQKTVEKQQARISDLEKIVAELHEQVDAALGAEEMVEHLGLQKLGLEDEIKELKEAVSDLEALQDINDQLQEDSRELELQLREEVDNANIAMREARREKENTLEALADRELTIVKFRELVQKLQDQCQELQQQLQKENASHDSMKMSIPEMLDFKKMFAETRAQARAIDLELRRIEVMQGQQHVKYLTAFMPDSFLTRGGDNDALLTIMLIQRLMWKCEILLSQLRDKFPSVELSNKGELVKGHTAEQFASRCRLSYHIYLLQAVLRQFKYGLDTCTTEVLQKTAASLPEMSQQERILDSYIELLKSDKLDENAQTENLVKCVNYFNTMHTLLLLSSGEHYIHQTKLLSDHTVAFSTACDSIRTDMAIVQALIQNDDVSDVSPLCQHLSTVAEVIQQHLKQIRRRISMVPDATTLPVPDMTNNLLKTSISASQLTKVLRDIARTAFSQIALTTDDISLSSQQLLDILNSSCEKTFDDMPANGWIACLKNSMNYFANVIANIAQAVQEAESYSPSNAAKQEDKTEAPILVRAALVKKELEQTKALKSKLDTKDSDIRELKILVKIKQEEIGELTIRKDIAEKKVANSDTKLANTIRDYEQNVQKLQRKLDEANQLMKRKETEFEETMDHLQADIDSLECEKGELKDKLKSYSKKVLIDGIVKNANISGSSPMSVGNLSSPVAPSMSFEQDPILLARINALRAILTEERRKRYQLENTYYKEKLDKLEHIPVFKQDSQIDPEILSLEKKVKDYQNDVVSYMSRITVVDVTKRVPGTWPTLDKDAPIMQLRQQVDEVRALNLKGQKLKLDYVNLMMKRKRGCQVQTNFGSFPTTDMKKIMETEQPEPFCVIKTPCSQVFPKPMVIDVTVSLNEIDKLMKTVFNKVS